jgi:Grx4 family monothiol glutaredoxin
LTIHSVQSILQPLRSFCFSNSKYYFLQVVAHFWAGWCEPCTLLDQVLEQLGTDAPSVACIRIEAEEASDLSERCNVSVVPLLLFFSGGKEVDRLEGADPAGLSTKFLSLANAPTQQPTRTNNGVQGGVGGNGAVVGGSNGAPVSLRQRINALVNSKPVMLFMKGNPDMPQCGFSGKVVQALKNAGATDFGHFDILTDEAIRQGLKEYSQWPTYPQVYVNGELLGGCDIVLEMAENGELAAELAKGQQMNGGGGSGEVIGNPKEALEARINALVRESPVMLFMKGT